MKITTEACRREIIAWINRQVDANKMTTINAKLIMQSNWKRRDKHNEGDVVVRVFENGAAQIKVAERDGKLLLTWIACPPDFKGSYNEGVTQAEDRTPKPESWGDFA